MNTFELISKGFARHVLGNSTTGDPIRDAAKALTMNHLLNNEKGTSSRLTGWAIFRASGSTVQANLAAKGVMANDGRTRYEAFADELSDFREPVVFLQFTKSTVNLGNVFATFDPRVTKICAPDVAPEIFDFSVGTLPETAGVAERNIRKAVLKKEKSNAA
ncbi:hypothetical protein C1J05_04065 [Sulfitobacter sp. JL08]|uniref:hypothetical protein n=1 Tax=Sulfitobacter sp. JL08 TaxID=2070369 RepID=UPI000E0C6F11|nr:hypothetical protein [Sulfitobacter sp. JL08]AXI53784.1 hypothetical protein C1J05_04065 [Sulfitobacter sp. JL08]